MGKKKRKKKADFADMPFGAHVEGCVRLLGECMTDGWRPVGVIALQSDGTLQLLLIDDPTMCKHCFGKALLGAAVDIVGRNPRCRRGPALDESGLPAAPSVN